MRAVDAVSKGNYIIFTPFAVETAHPGTTGWTKFSLSLPTQSMTPTETWERTHGHKLSSLVSRRQRSQGHIENGNTGSEGVVDRKRRLVTGSEDLYDRKWQYSLCSEFVVLLLLQQTQLGSTRRLKRQRKSSEESQAAHKLRTSCFHRIPGSLHHHIIPGPF